MATVYLARGLHDESAIALKVLHPELAPTVGADRFKREIRVAAQLQHPNILGILDSGETPGPPEAGGGQLWFTMPLVEGENVYERLQRKHSSRLTRPSGSVLRQPPRSPTPTSKA